MLVKRFKNGNYNVKMESDDFNSEGTLINLIWVMYDVDCVLFGEEYCLSNWEMAVDMYDCYNDTLVRIPYSILNDLEEGKTVKLYARKLDEYDREEYKRLEELGEL